MLGRYFTVYDILFEERERISESSTSGLCYYFESFFFCFYMLSLAYIFETSDDIFESDLSEVEPERT